MKKSGHNKDGSVRKKGSGRPKGANSFTLIGIGDLTNLMAGLDEKIPVSRVWLKKRGAAYAVKLCDELNDS